MTTRPHNEPGRERQRRLAAVYRLLLDLSNDKTAESPISLDSAGKTAAIEITPKRGSRRSIAQRREEAAP